MGLALVLAACGATGPSRTPEGRVATACIGLLTAQCELAIGALSDKRPGDSATYVAASARTCDGPCPGAERGVWLGHLMVEYSDGRKPVTIIIAVDGGAIDWKPIETQFVKATPQSAPLKERTTELTLGHCGVGSGIDVDGAFWDPIGLIDSNEQALINTAKARFTLNSPDSAVLVTEGGAVLQLVRHQGPKFLPGCD